MDFETLAQKRDFAQTLIRAFLMPKLKTLGQYDGYLGGKDNCICLDLEKTGTCYFPFAVTKN